MPALLINPYLKIIIFCILMMFFTVPRHAGFMLSFWLLFIIPSIIKNLYFIVFKNKEKKQRLIKISIMLISCLIVVVNHVYHYKISRNYAITVSNSLQKYYLKNGAYPLTIESIGVQKEILNKYGIHYSNNDGIPSLMYPVTWIIYDSYYYDFELNLWRYMS